MGSSHWPSTYTSCTTAAQVYSYRCPLNHCDYDYPLDQILLSVPNMHVSLSFQAIEEGLKQKTRQNVVVLDWGSRSNAALGNFGMKV